MAQLFKTCGDNNQTLCKVNNSAVQVFTNVEDMNAAYALGCIQDGDIVAVPDSCYQATTCIAVYDNVNIGQFPLHIEDTSLWNNVSTSCNNNFIIGSGCYAVCGNSCESYSGGTAVYNNNIYIGTSNTVRADENDYVFASTSSNTIIGFNNIIPSGGRNTVIGSDNNVCGVTCSYKDGWSLVSNNIIIGHCNEAYNWYMRSTDEEDTPHYESNNQIIIGCGSTSGSGITIGNDSRNSNLFDAVLIGNKSYAFNCCGIAFTISKLWTDNEYYREPDGCGYGTHVMYEIKFARAMIQGQCTCCLNCDVYNAFAIALCCVGCNFTSCPGWLTGSISGNTWIRCGSNPNCMCSICGIEHMYMSSSCICFRLNGGGCALCYGNNTTANTRHFVGSMLVMREY